MEVLFKIVHQLNIPHFQLWLMLASLLTKFTISPKRDAEGKETTIADGIDDLGVLQ